MARLWTVHLFRSGRVWVSLGDAHKVSQDVDQPLLTEQIDAPTEIAALGRLLIKYVDRANQPMQHICPPCECRMCKCGLDYDLHNVESVGHTFIPVNVCERPHIDDPFNIEAQLHD